MSDRRVTERLALEGAEQATRQLEQFGVRGTAALERLNKSGEPASRSLLAVNAASRELQNGAAGLASRLGPVGSVLQSLGPIGTAAAAALAGVGVALAKGVKEADETDRAQKRIQAVLKATGQASGQTLSQIEALVEGISRSTLATEGDVRQASQQLLTFKAVAGDAFGETLKLSQDLASLGFGSMSSNAVRLGKALEDPVRGVAQLREVGISFSAAQTDVIKKLVETGQAAEAQHLILETLRQQVGGSGAEDANSVAGAFHVLGENVGDFLEAVARRSGVLDTLIAQMRTLGGLAKDAATGIAGGLEADLRAVEAQLAGLEPRNRSPIQLNFDREAGERAAAEFERQRREADAARNAGTRPQDSSSRQAELRAELEARRDLLRVQIEDQRRFDREAANLAKERAASAAAEREAERKAALAAEAAKKEAEEAEKRRLAAQKTITEAATKQAVEHEKELLRQQEASRKLVEEEARKREEILGTAEEQARIAGLTTEEREVQLELLRAEEQLGHKLGDADRERLANAVRLREANEKQQEAAKKSAEELARITERSIQRVVDFGADALFNLWEGQASDFWEEFETLGKRAISQVASELLIRQPLQQFAGSVLGGGAGGSGAGGGGLGSILGSIGQSAASSALSDSLGLGSIASGVGASLFGTAGGSGAAIAAAHAAGVAAVPGGVAAAGTAGAFGGVGTALAAIPGWGWAALAALAVIGGSGLLSKESRRGPTTGASINVLPTGQFGITATGGDNGGDPNALVGEAQRAVEALNKLAKATGTTLTQAEFAKVVRQITVGTGDAFTNNVVSFEKGGFRGAEDVVRDLAATGLFGTVSDELLANALNGLDPFVEALGEAAQAVSDETRAKADLIRETQRNAQQFQQLSLRINDSILGLTIGSGSTLSPEARLTEARGAFTSFLSKSRAGDLDAIARLPGVAGDFLDASRAFNASGPGFQQNRDLALAALREIEALTSSRATEAEQQLAELTRQTDLLGAILLTLAAPGGPDAAALQAQIAQATGISSETVAALNAVATQATQAAQAEAQRTTQPVGPATPVALGSPNDPLGIGLTRAQLDLARSIGLGQNRELRVGDAEIYDIAGRSGKLSAILAGAYADGGISTGPQLAMVSEGRYRNEAHVPLPDGRTIPVSLGGGLSERLDRVVTSLDAYRRQSANETQALAVRLDKAVAQLERMAGSGALERARA